MDFRNILLIFTCIYPIIGSYLHMNHYSRQSTSKFSDAHRVRKMFYFYSLIWMFFVQLTYASFRSPKLYFDSILLNHSLLLIITFVSIFIWESIFISSKSIKNFKFKDTEITFEEMDSINYLENFRAKQVEIFNDVLDCKRKTMIHIDDKFELTEDSDEFLFTQLHVINYYSRCRKNLEIRCEYIHESNYSSLGGRYSIKDFPKVAYIMEHFGYCSFRNKDDYLKRIISKVNTRLSTAPIFIDMIGDLMDEEHAIIIDILNYYDLKFELEYYKLLDSESHNDDVV